MRISVIALLLVFSISVSAVYGDGTPRKIKLSKAKAVEFFEKRIRPVLVDNCYRCHSAESKKNRGGFVLDTREGIRKGGDTGHGVVPGNLKASLVIKAIEYHDEDLQMPPKEKLPDSVIADFRRWVQIGAPDPRDGTVKTAKKYGNDDKLWSLEAVKNPAPPQVKNAAWPRADLDRFILARLEEKNLKPVGDAQAVALLRRLHYDLIGLPPSPERIASFMKEAEAKPQAAIAAEVDRLLASSHFGERWGRHWLDVARYGDSNGRDRDVLFPHAWRYRNYVIDAFNADMNYQVFIQEQVAGDLLPDADTQRRNERIVATGFLTLGPKSFMKRGKAFEMDLVDEQIDVTTRAFLGLTASCARCHDHKFDPIPTKDYYALAGIFCSTQTLFGPSNQKKGTGNLQPLGDGKTKVDPKKRQQYQQELTKLNKQIRAATVRLKKLQGGETIKTKAGKSLNAETEKKRLARLQGLLKDLQASAPKAQEFCMAVRDGKPQDLRVMIRGEINKLGDPAPRGFLTAVKLDDKLTINRKKSGRLELAKWLSSLSNPLTARVAVNRIWLHLFGQGLVRTTDNFGRNGEKPSHPELLDYLATRFMENGWSTKKLIREIVLSRTYQLDTAYSEKSYEVDPDNILLWRRSLRRLDVEAIRDTLLAASGKLDRERPEKSLAAQLGYGEVGRGINESILKAPFPHRTIYMAILRTDLPEVLKVWDFAEPSLVVGQRSVTTVPSQALYLMNNEFVIDNAKTMAERLLKGKMSDSERISLAYQLALARSPSDKEGQRALAFLERIQQNLSTRYSDEQERQRVAWTGFCQALFASAEFRYLN